tara:strand:- start:270 stop:530 length:261 start_codon:yes stop_codon:yes gene_type:complete
MWDQQIENKEFLNLRLKNLEGNLKDKNGSQRSIKISLEEGILGLRIGNKEKYEEINIEVGLEGGAVTIKLLDKFQERLYTQKEKTI